MKKIQKTITDDSGTYTKEDRLCDVCNQSLDDGCKLNNGSVKSFKFLDENDSIHFECYIERLFMEFSKANANKPEAG